eukprot:6942792-Ditylum_brightwellii.AAC.1
MLEWIGVFAKPNNAVDDDWDDNEDKSGSIKPGTFWELEERIMGTADDYKDADEPHLGVARGFIAVVIHNTRSGARKNQTLTEQNICKQEWKQSSFERDGSSIQTVDLT